MDQVTVPRELLRQVLGYVEGGNPGHIADKINVLVKLRTALEQPAVEHVKLGTEWTPCMKLPVVVHVRQQRPGEQHVSTREGITPVKPDDLIMRGVSGEEYPIGRAIFEQTYTLEIAAPQAQQPAPVGDSNFESWYATYDPSGKGDKQRARDAYAAALLDCVFDEPQPQQPDARTAAIQECIDRLVRGGKPAEAQMLRHHFGVEP